MKTSKLLIIPAMLLALNCNGEEKLQTKRAEKLIGELLTKLDSTDIFAARKQKEIEDAKSLLPGKSVQERYEIYLGIASKYASCQADSTLLYLSKARETALTIGEDSLILTTGIKLAKSLAIFGFSTESKEILESIPRKKVTETNTLVPYYGAWASLYHGLYSCFGEPSEYRNIYRGKYNVYRDSLLMVTDPTSEIHLRELEKKLARAGNFEEARKYNAISLSRITDFKSGLYATRLYDRFAIANNYERKLTGQAIEDLLESAIIEVERNNQDIASLLRVEEYLLKINEVKAAQKVSDYYYSTLQKFGSRKRLLEGINQTLEINNRNIQQLQRRKNDIQLALALISLLVVAVVLMLIKINNKRLKITKLNEDLQQSGKISKSYVGVVFLLYSSYIKRLESFRARIHTSLKKGNIEQALELTSPLNDIENEEIKELYHNFDSAFIDIFPDYIKKVNGCFKPESRIIPKKTEILTTELRILALIKLGIEDSTKIAEMLHCSVKTVYNLRSGIKARLAIPVEEFKRELAEF